MRRHGNVGRFGRATGLAVLAALLALPVAAQQALPVAAQQARPGDGVLDTPQLQLGAAIYLRGEGSGGRAVRAQAQADVPVQGSEAACVRCHRPSGLGQVEGQLRVPPITGHALFQPSGGVALMSETRSSRMLNTAHAPYTSDDFATALRTGLAVGGREMHAIMPRYDLDAVEVAALETYLRQLSQRWSPGVTAHEIALATVLTPDLQGARRASLQAMVKGYVERHNLGVLPNRRHMVGATQFVLKTERRWRHSFWVLEGAPASWEAQLREWQRRAPAFALVSGAGQDWRVVDRFCATTGMPCWFPSTALPADTEDLGARADVSLHFSRGVLLEADRLASLEDTAGLGVLSATDASDEAAGGTPTTRAVALAATRRLASGLTQRQQAAPVAFQAGQAVAVCWCTPQNLARLMLQAPPAPRVYVSASLLEGATLAAPAGADGGPDESAGAGSAKNAGDVTAASASAAAITSAAASASAAAAADRGAGLLGAAAPDQRTAWQRALRVVQPYADAGTAQANLRSLHAWLALNHLPVVDEALQSDVYFSLSWLSETLSEMLNNLHRDYLVERGTTMLERREQLVAAAEQRMDRSARAIALQSRQAATGGRPLPAVQDHAGTTVYPHLSLGAGQRFASRGAGVLAFEPTGPGLQWQAGAGWALP